MAPKDIILDDEANKLLQELGGIDTTERVISPAYRLEDLDEGLREEESRLDNYRILLVELTHLLSVYFRDVQYWEEAKAEERHFTAIVGVLRELAQSPGRDDSILIRYRGAPSDPKISIRNDYVILFGNLMLDLDILPVVVRRQGARASHLSGRLGKAFQMFSDNGISNIHINVMAETPVAIERLLICLRILSRYKQALETDSPIVFDNKGEEVTLTICPDEKRKADINLTLVTGLNGLNARTMNALIQKVAKLLQHAETSATFKPHASLYDAIFKIKNLKEQLIEPPITVNNTRWLMVDRIHDDLSREKAKLVRLVIDNLGNSPHDVVRLINSVYSGDYARISSDHLVSRLESATELMNTIEKNVKDPEYEKEVLRNVRSRMAQVDDTVYNDLFIQKDSILVRSAGKEPVLSTINAKLLRLTQFYIRRSKTRQKVRSIVTETITFDAHDFDILGKDFGIPTDAAERLIAILQSCFDAKGNFHRSIFESNIPEFVQHERKVFEFLWYYSKKTSHRNDRVAFLNSLQLLAAQMKRPQLAVHTLLNDFYEDPAGIDYSDRNALMLSTLFLRKYNKELNLDIELTPEEILLIQEGLNEDVVRASSARLDEDQDRFFEKLRTIHREIIHALDGDPQGEKSMPLKHLLSLEREVHIFMSLLPGNTARSGIRNAVKIYGFPESIVYQMRESKKHLAALLQHLKVAVRGLGRVGGKRDLILLEAIRSSENGFLGLGKGPRYEEQIRRTMESVEVATSNLTQSE